MNREVELSEQGQAGPEKTSVRDVSQRQLSSKSFKGAFDKPSNIVAGGIEKGFRWLGSMVGGYPIVFIGIAVLFCGIMIPGNGQLVTENRGEKLWIPSGTESQDDKDYIDARYQEFARFEQIEYLGCGNTDMLQPQFFDFMFEIHQSILAMPVDFCPDDPNDDSMSGEYVEEAQDCKYQTEVLIFEKSNDTSEQTFEERCYIYGADCYMQNILAIFNYDPALWATRQAILARINDIPNLNIIQDTQWSGGPFRLEQLLGGITRNGAGQVESAKVVAFNYYLRSEEELTSDNALVDYKGEAWEEKYLDYLEDQFDINGTCGDQGDREGTFQILRFASRSFDDEFGGTINSDLAFLAVAIIVIVIYSLLMMSRWSYGLSGMRLISTIASLGSIGLAYIAGQGLMGYAGVFTSALVSVLPFLLVGIGVDDTFVLINAYDNTDPKLSVRERIGETYASAGTSVTVTSLTNFFAFIIGSNTSLPALRNFSIFAAIGIIFIYFLQLTLFGGFFVYDSRRQKRGLYELCCCYGAGEGCFPRTYIAQPAPKCGCLTPDQWLGVVMKYLGYALQNFNVKVFVIITYVALLAGGIAGVVKIPVDADVNDFIPPGSYVETWLDVNDEYFTTVGESVGVYFMDIEYEKPDIQQEMLQALDIMIANEYTLNNITDYSVWLLVFRNSRFVPGNSRQAYAEAVFEFVNSPEGARFDGDIVFRNDSDGLYIETSRFTGNYKVIDKSQEQVKSMQTLRDEIEDGLQDPFKQKVFAYSPGFLQYEQYAGIGREVITNLGLAMLMVLVIISLLLFNLYASTLTFLLIFSIVLELVGYMYWWGFSVDSVTVIFWVISLGLSVDYNVHITHGFLYQIGEGSTRYEIGNSRMQKALEETGVGIINGAFSTFLAVLCLSASASYVFITFFRALLLVTVFGMFHGMIVLPVFLSLFQPGPHGHLVK